MYTIKNSMLELLELLPRELHELLELLLGLISQASRVGTNLRELVPQAGP